MKNWFRKKLQPAALALAMVVGMLCGNAAPVKAAEQTTLYELKETEVIVGQEVSIPFTLTKKSEVDFNIFVKDPSVVSISVCDGAGKNVDWAKKAFTVWEENFVSVKDGYYGYVDTLTDVPAGDYIYKMVFTKNTTVMVGVYATPVSARISQTEATITQNYSSTLYVSQGTVSQWKSDKPGVARVDKNGKVVGVKPGKATVTATMEDGQKVRCAVTVKSNTFTDSRLTTGDVRRNQCSMEAYKASFDDKGNLNIKISYVNNTADRITALKNVSITVKDQNGKTVGTYKAKNLKLFVPAKSAKRFSVTIKKADLTKKTADLRNAQITCKGKYVYSKTK